MELSTKRQLGRKVVQLIELEQVELLGLHPRGPSYVNSVAFDVTAAFCFVLLDIIKLKT